MKNPELLCLGCMEELECPGDTCRKCGFNREEYERNRNVRTLPSYTILVGKYLLGRVLGEGGFGITYIAWDLNRECRVAIKEYFPVGLATRDTRGREGESLTVMPGEQAAYYRNGLRNFAEEGKNLARFHELSGIVSVRDFFQDNETAYIVMDYVEGMNLKQYLTNYYAHSGEHAPMNEKQVLRMMQPVLDSLIEVHKTGVIHRDISPENIICGRDGRITLIDFGAARVATGNETRSLTIMLKHGYAPPEQYQSHGKQGAWTDIYAICATMYHMMSGYLPAESIDRVFDDSLPALEAVNPQISKTVSDIIKKGMSVRIEDRYQTVEEMCQLLYPKETMEKEKEEPKYADPNASVKEEVDNKEEENVYTSEKTREEKIIYSGNPATDRELEEQENVIVRPKMGPLEIGSVVILVLIFVGSFLV